jgi:hypothetical protein
MHPVHVLHHGRHPPMAAHHPSAHATERKPTAKRVNQESARRLLIALLGLLLVLLLLVVLRRDVMRARRSEVVSARRSLRRLLLLLLLLLLHKRVLETTERLRAVHTRLVLVLSHAPHTGQRPLAGCVHTPSPSTTHQRGAKTATAPIHHLGMADASTNYCCNVPPPPGSLRAERDWFEGDIP